MRCIYEAQECNQDPNYCQDCRDNTSTDSLTETRRKLIQAGFGLKSGSDYMDKRVDQYLDYLGGRPHSEELLAGWITLHGNIVDCITLPADVNLRLGLLRR